MFADRTRVPHFLLLTAVGCSRPAADLVVVAVPVPVVVTLPADPPVPPLAAVVPLSLGVPPAAVRPVPLAFPDDAAGRLVADLLRPVAPPLPVPAPPEPKPPETWLDRGHRPLPEVPPPTFPAPPLPPATGAPSRPPERVPAELGEKYLPDLKRLTVPDQRPPVGLGKWLVGLAGGPLPGLAGSLPIIR